MHPYRNVSLGATFALRLQRKLADWPIRLSVALLAILTSTSGAALGVPFVSSFHVQSSMSRHSGTADYNFVLSQDCPPGSQQPVPGCKTMRVRYSTTQQSDVVRLLAVDVLRPVDPPDGWKEFPLPEGSQAVSLYLERAQWALPVYPDLAGTNTEPQARNGAIVFHGYFRDETGQHPVSLVAVMQGGSFLPAFTVDAKWFPLISTDGDFSAYSKGSYLRVPERHTNPYASEGQTGRTDRVALSYVRDVPLTHRSWDVVLAEKAERDAARQKEEEARLAREKAEEEARLAREKEAEKATLAQGAQEAAERAAWAAEVNTPKEIKSAQQDLAAVFQNWTRLVTRNLRSRPPCDTVANSSGANLLRLRDTYQSIKTSPVPKGVPYQILLRDAQVYYDILRRQLSGMGCGA